MTITIAGFTAVAGRKTSGHLVVPKTNDEHHDEEESVVVRIPLTVVNGVGNDDNDDGPVVVVLCGVHGSEYVPVATSQRLARELDPSLVRGAVILVHAANPPAFFGRTVYDGPVDGANLNRVFPGRADGTFSERVAHALVNEVYPWADHLLDVHSGDANERLAPTYAAYYGRATTADATANAVVERSRDMAYAFGSEIVVEFGYELNETSRGIWAGSAAVVRGVPSIDVETAPGAGRAPAEAVDEALRGVARVLRAVGALVGADDDDDETPRSPCLVRERSFVEAPTAGYWTPTTTVDVGALVERGAVLGRVTDLTGRVDLFEAVAPVDGLLLIRFATPPVNAGDTLAVVAALNETDPACDRTRWDGATTTTITRRVDDVALALSRWRAAAIAGWATVVLGVMCYAGGLRRRGRDRRSYVRSRQAEDDNGLSSSCAARDEEDLRVV